jgi:hypothetical protein
VVEGLARQAEQHVEFRGSDTFAYDMRLCHPYYAAEAEIGLRSALDGYLLAAYHATRLLHHEGEWLRADGLLPLTDDLRRRKLAGARRHHPELISDDEVALLLASGPLSWQSGERSARLNVVAPLAMFLHDRGLPPLLDSWGGESIAWAGKLSSEAGQTCAAAVKRLSAVSIPTIVEVGLAARELCDYKHLWPAMVGNLLGLRMPWNQWILESSVPPTRVLDVIQPGHRRWPALPSSTSSGAL